MATIPSSPVQSTRPTPAPVLLSTGSIPTAGAILSSAAAFLGGIQVNEKFYFETKLGLGDVPDWKFVLGWGK
jgi:hypothetical protein